MQLVNQLAYWWHFSYNPATFETVTLSHFLKGRVNINHVVRPEVARFSIVATELGRSMAELRRLFFEGAKSQGNNLMRATRGRGADWHLLSLMWSVKEGEEIPAIFASPLFKGKSRPSKVMTD